MIMDQVTSEKFRLISGSHTTAERSQSAPDGCPDNRGRGYWPWRDRQRISGTAAVQRVRPAVSYPSGAGMHEDIRRQIRDGVRCFVDAGIDETPHTVAN